MSSVEISQVLAQMRTLSAGTQMVRQNSEGPKPDFSELLANSVEMVNRTQTEAKSMKESYQLGEAGVELPEVMIALQKANISFEAMKQVRNKLLTAYQEISNMQV